MSSGSSAEVSKAFSQASQSLISNDGFAVVSIVKNVQILFYLLSSMQITSTLILINTTLPIHLYSTLQVMASCVFTYVPSWEEDNSHYEQPSLPLGLESHTQAEFLYLNQVPPYMFQRVRYSSNFILNASQSIILLVVMWGIYHLTRLLYRKLKASQNRTVAVNSARRLAFELAYNFVIKTHDAVFLNVVLSVILQIINPNFQSAFNSFSLLCAVLFILYFMRFYYKAFLRINYRKISDKKRMEQFIDKHSPLIEDIKFEQDLDLKKNKKICFCI